MEGALSWNTLFKSFSCLFGQADIGCQAPSGMLLTFLSAGMAGLGVMWITAVKQAVRRGFQQGGLTTAVGGVLFAEFLWFQSVPAVFSAVSLFMALLLFRTALSRQRVSVPFARKVDLYQVLLVCVPFLYVLTHWVAEPIYYSLYPKKLAVFLLPPPTRDNLTPVLRESIFTQIRAALQDGLSANQSLDVLPLADVLQKFSEFDKSLGGILGISDQVAKTAPYEAGHDIRFLVNLTISLYIPVQLEQVH